MIKVLTLDTALCLPAPEIRAVTDGRLVAVLSGVSMTKGLKFVLCPSSARFFDKPIDQYYQTDFLSTAHTVLEQLKIAGPTLEYWAECQGCSIIDTPEELNAIAALGIWHLDVLKTWLAERQFLIIAFLRTYQLPTPVTETAIPKVGKFIGLSNPIQVHQKRPILEDLLFRHRLEQAQAFQLPKHSELEALNTALEQSTLVANPAAQAFQSNLRHVLDWKPVPVPKADSQNTDWINQIAALGERSKELDAGKSNYRAGTEFEDIVRKSLEFLGFTINYYHQGKAGGLDLVCSEPYLLIGECKAGKSIPNTTAVQLLNLGTLRLKTKEAFNRSKKIIIGPGIPTTQLADAAKVHGMAIINPHTLEKLVKLQHQHPGSIDLIELKKYLIDGRADDEVTLYIEQIKSKLHLRSFIVKQVREYLLNAKAQSANVDSLHAVYTVSNPPKRLSRKEFYDILVELASPFSGYLGRQQTPNGDDSFYFLRYFIVGES
ncbi:MAG: DUF1802 family protein [Cyanobacteria bacterium P01_D01_bin.156]